MIEIALKTDKTIVRIIDRNRLVLPFLPFLLFLLLLPFLPFLPFLLFLLFLPFLPFLPFLLFLPFLQFLFLIVKSYINPTFSLYPRLGLSSTISLILEFS